MVKFEAWAFHGVIKDDSSDMRAYSTAGNLAQTGFIDGCQNVGQDPALIISMPLRRAYPNNSLFVKSSSNNLVRQIGYINLPIIKFITFSMNIYVKNFNMKLPNFVISYNPSFMALLIGYLHEVFTGRPYIPMIFDIIVPGKNTGNKLLANLNYRFYKLFLRRFKGVIVISKAIVRDFSLNRNALIIEGGLPRNTIKRFEYINKSESDDKKSFVILFAGGMESENGIFEMIEAMRFVKSKNACLHLYGSGPLSEAVAQACIGLENVKYMGYVDHSIVLERIKSANLLINIRVDARLSTKYFFPSKLIEYLSSGVPVLSTTFESLPAEYYDFLYLTKSESPEDISNQIDRVISLPEMEREILSHRAKEWVVSRKSWEQQASYIVSWAAKVAEGGK